MECKDIQEKLLAYREENISSEERMLIEEHVKSCQKCHEYLADMKKTIQYVRDLEEIEPPQWLAPKIMARIKAESSPKKGIFQRLFYPLYIKLPIQAAATILIAFSALYVYKTIQPDVKFVEVTSDEREAQIRSQESYGTIETKKSQPASLQGEKQFLQTKGFEYRKDKIEEVPKVTEKMKQPVLSDKKQIAPSVASQEIRHSMGSVGKSDDNPETEYRLAKTQAPAVKKVEHIGFTVYVKDIETATIKIKDFLDRSKGKIIKTESQEGKRNIIAELKTESMQDLLKTLKLTGEVQEKRSDFEISGEVLLVEIEFVKQ